MTGMVWQRSKLKFATKLLPNCFWGVRYVAEMIGGPDRDRTDDLFHAMEARSQLRHRPTLAVGQLFYFRRSGWIRQTSPSPMAASFGARTALWEHYPGVPVSKEIETVKKDQPPGLRRDEDRDAKG